jgi:hypothetical protein
MHRRDTCAVTGGARPVKGSVAPPDVVLRLALAALVAVLAAAAFFPFRLDVPGRRTNGASPGPTGIVFERPS